MQLWTRPFDNPIRHLVTLFLFWKTLILVIACCSPGPGYDTSTSLALATAGPGEARALPAALQYIIGKLTRWDAIYFFQAAHRGYLFEQEWAFGWGLSRVIAISSASLESAGLPHYEGIEAVVAILIAHLAHLLAVLLLFKLTLEVFSGSNTKFAFNTAALHVISPAGVFLSAPYAESSCALFAFAGCLAFAKSYAFERQTTSTKHDSLLILSGVLFGISTTFRSNGILNGLLLLEEAFRALWSLKHGVCISSTRRLLASGVGGVSVGIGFLLPQYIAYSDFCTEQGVATLRPWCTKPLPSIYTFVQDYYWNCGWFRYWTLSNLPLFLLAAPMIAVMVVSEVWGLNFSGNEKAASSKGVDVRLQIVRNLAVSQLLLTLITFTTAHVQIITRLSSAYPVWLWYAASSLGKGDAMSGILTKFMVMYAAIQGGLFASFLPPA